jgi:alpha-ketoglutarate-dependent taurine dioxygenase
LAGDGKIQHLTPTTGSEVTGVQLSKLTNEGKDQLALLVAQRKVVAFRDQDFADLPIQDALNWGGYFGRHHIHPTSGSPEGYPEVHIVHKYGATSEQNAFFANKNSSVSWHSDVSYEKQPPGTTFLYIFDSPEVGGDTAFVNQVEAYNRLSEGFKERLHGLKALHSGVEQVEFSKQRGGVVRREPVINEHPLVRTHPATGEKALYINPGFTRSIVGYKKEESDALLKFLYDHIGRGIDYQARVRWAPKTIVVWDVSTYLALQKPLLIIDRTVSPLTLLLSIGLMALAVIWLASLLRLSNHLRLRTRRRRLLHHSEKKNNQFDNEDHWRPEDFQTV